MCAISQSTNIYAYCMNNPLRYIDLCGAEAGDPFKSRDKAAIDFAETTNGISIKEDLEYAAYIYSWKEEEKFLWFIPVTKTYYSYTEPFTSYRSDSVDIDTISFSLPKGSKWESMIHTHGAHTKDKYTGKYDDFFSNVDEKLSDKTGISLYLATPNGKLLLYEPTEGFLVRTKEIVSPWKLPHDKNHPDLPDNHGTCEDCY